MKRISAFAICLGLLGGMSIGCSEKSTTETKTTIETPDGTTTETVTTEIEQSGDNPPPVSEATP